MASSSSHTQLQQGDEGIGTEISGTAIVGILRRGTCVVCTDGITTFAQYNDVQTEWGGTERIYEPQSVNKKLVQKIHYITPTVFVAFAGNVPDAHFVIGRVKTQLEFIPPESMDEIAATFVRWSNRMVVKTREGEKNDYLVFGRLRKEHPQEMIQIFYSDNSLPKFRAANASNALSVKVCSAVPPAGYTAHRRAMCAIGTGDEQILSYLRSVAPIKHKEKQIRQVAMAAVVNACKKTKMCGGDIFMVTLSGHKHNAPRFHTASHKGKGNKIVHGKLKEGGFKPVGYDEA